VRQTQVKRRKKKQEDKYMKEKRKKEKENVGMKRGERECVVERVSEKTTCINSICKIQMCTSNCFLP
jgi:hypothetical protein